MTQKRFKEEFLEEMNEIKKEKSERVTVDDIIGLIKTDEPTNSVEEVRKLRGRETEKRFTIVNMGLDGRLIKEDGKIIELERVVDLLNENEKLKSEIEKLSYANEDLLSEKRNWQRMSDEYCKLSEENEQLKQEVEDLKQALIRCAFDDK